MKVGKACFLSDQSGQRQEIEKYPLELARLEVNVP